MNTHTINLKKERVKAFRHAEIYLLSEVPHVAVVEAVTGYIPIENFKEIFNYLTGFVRENSITTLVFDKRKLTVFHQPSMEWYFVEWKEQMFSYGLKKHRKILPDDRIFRESVKIGREKINRSYPDRKFHQMDIQYATSLEEAVLM